VTGSSAAVTEMKQIAALMRDSGLTVLSSSGWETRGKSSSVNYWAVLCHHTAATDDIDNMLINGRPDVSGPLCNWALHENGDWVLLASGRANHAGEGTLPSSESYGIEATGPQGYPDTYGPKAFPGNYSSYDLGVACMLAVMGADIPDVFGHKETARPVGRKIDPYFDMGKFRSDVDTGGTEEDMPLNDTDLVRIKNIVKEVVVDASSRIVMATMTGNKNSYVTEQPPGPALDDLMEEIKKTP
jgi:N-acetylmuramoyl-L-alanine amidase